MVQSNAAGNKSPRLKTIRRVVAAGGVGVEGIIAVRRVVDAGGVGVEGIIAVRRVVVAGGKSVKCKVADSHVPRSRCSKVTRALTYKSV